MEEKGDGLCQRALGREAGGGVVRKEHGLRARDDLKSKLPKYQLCAGVTSNDLSEPILLLM